MQVNYTYHHIKQSTTKLKLVNAYTYLYFTCQWS